MIKKTQKNCSRPYGTLITDEAFLKPCILGIFPENSHQKTLNGYLNKIMYLMQIRHFGETDSDYDISSIPFDIIAYEKNDNTSITKLLESIPENNLDAAKSIIRNINIISYCNGHNITNKLIHEIREGLLKKKYSNDEVNVIMQNIFVLQIVDNFVVNREFSKFPYVTSVIVHNIDDDENIQYQRINADFLKNINILSDFERDIKILLYKSFGEGSLQEERREHDFSKDYIYAPILNAFMSYILINAINSSLKHDNLNLDKLFANLSSIEELANNYIEKHQKKLSDYTKEDLKELSNVLMKNVQAYCIQELALKPLNQDEKAHLEEHDELMKKYAHLGINSEIEYKLQSIQYTLREIFKYNDEYNKDDEIRIPGNIEIYGKVSEIVKDKINKLISHINDLLSYIDSINLKEEFNKHNIHQEYDEYIKMILNMVKNIATDEKLTAILDEYQMGEQLKKM